MSLEQFFQNNEKKALKSLEEAKINKSVDAGIVPTLDLINKHSEYYTTSSCFGRIVLLELPVIGDKKNAKWLSKWHRKITSEEILSACNKSKNGQLWILAQPPIIHICVKNLDAADRILKIGISSGFKNSGLKSISKNIVVELCSTERLDAPVGKDGVLFCDKDYLNLIVNIANDVFERSTKKTLKFHQNLKKLLSTQKTTDE